MKISEANFEAHIEHILRNVNGYNKRISSPVTSESDYDHDLCLIPQDVIEFVQATQPEAWMKIKKTYQDETETKFLARLATEIDKRGTLDVLRKGIKDAGAKFDLVYFVPATSMNADYQRQYEGNVFSVIRQLYYTAGRKLSLDMAIFINGLPIFTVELKNSFTGQTVENAIYQYRNDRDPKAPLFKFKRCLGHFAVDPDLVYVTTRLEGKSTFFLPFNKGKYGGAGNVPVHDNYATHYLWEEIWTKDSILNILSQFIHMIDVLDDKGKPTGKERIVFPRYHQLDAVRRLIDDVRSKGSGQRYLIQHSAGSGKSYSISWLAHQLSHLHDANNNRIFDSVIVITDRRILDKQLQASIVQFEQVLGTVETIDDKKTSADLAKALQAGKQIIVSTLQKYPVIVNQISELKGSNFAVIIDEAHSSQSGESVKSLKSVLSASNLEDAGKEENADPITWEDNINDSMRSRQHQTNISMFAFTATPKNKTLELFGTRRPDGKFEPFSLYSMRQAIEEKFILDVLENYTTYTAYWRLLKTVDDDPEYESRKSKALLRRFVEMHRDNIDKKIAIIVEHFKDNVVKQIGGKGKAMIVTRSRLHAVRYYLALKSYLKEHNLPYGAMIAFSGTVEDDGVQFTEAGMNGVSDKQTATTFHRDENRFLVVANKFQTGFDEPLLVAMYVDKLLSGVHAVQTLSRLNRQHPNKESTIVLDFANQADHIKASFQPYYETTLLSEATDHNLLYDRERELEEFHFYTQDEVDNFAQIYFAPSATQDQLHAPLDAIVERFNLATEDEQADFRSKLMDYTRLYSFLSQVIPFEDVELEKLYVFTKFLRRKLPISRSALPTEVLDNIDIGSYRLQQLSSGSLTPDRSIEELDPMLGSGVMGSGDDQREALSKILEALNEIFGDDAEKALEAMKEVKEVVVTNSAVNSSVRINTPDKARLTVDDVALQYISDLYKTKFDFYKRVNDDPYVRDFVLDWLFEEVLKEKNKSE